MAGWLVWTWQGSTSVLLCILVVLLVVILCSLEIKDPGVSKDDKGLEVQETTIQTPGTMIISTWHMLLPMEGKIQAKVNLGLEHI